MNICKRIHVHHMIKTQSCDWEKFSYWNRLDIRNTSVITNWWIGDTQRTTFAPFKPFIPAKGGNNLVFLKWMKRRVAHPSTVKCTWKLDFIHTSNGGDGNLDVM